MAPRLSDPELEYLKACYQCYKDGKNLPHTIRDITIPNFTVNDLIECQRSLMQKDLLSGSTTRTTAGVIYSPNSITQKGINLVEEILDDPLFGDLEPAIDTGFNGKKYRFTKYIKTHPMQVIGSFIAIIGVVIAAAAYFFPRS